MDQHVDLEELWKSQPVDTGVNGEEMRNLVLTKIAAFDRRIRRRNRTETIAGLIVAPAFAYFAWMQRDPIQRLGSIIIAAGALWIIYYLWRYGTGPADPASDQTLADYRRALALKYEHQIRLLRRVKFWYLAPLYVGLLTGSAGVLREQAKNGAITWADALLPLVYTLVVAGVWWLNEVYAVRKLRRQSAQLLSGIEEETQC